MNEKVPTDWTELAGSWTWRDTEGLMAQTKRPPGVTEQHLQVMSRLNELTEQNLKDKNEICDIVGVYAGVKPAALVKELYAKDAVELGLTSVDTSASAGGRLVISRYRRLAETMQELSVHLRPNPESVEWVEAQYKIGALLGFPPESTDVYLERWRIQQETQILPRLIAPNIEGDDRFFAQFVCSPEGSLGEKNYASDLANAVKKFTPNIYGAIVKAGHEREAVEYAQISVQW